MVRHNNTLSAVLSSRLQAEDELKAAYDDYKRAMSYEPNNAQVGSEFSNSLGGGQDSSNVGQRLIECGGKTSQIGERLGRLGETLVNLGRDESNWGKIGQTGGKTDQIGERLARSGVDRLQPAMDKLAEEKLIEIKVH
eukprot:3583328-Rhodomonas_salina.1